MAFQAIMALQASLTFVAGVAIMAFKAFSHSSAFPRTRHAAGWVPLQAPLVRLANY